MRLWKIVGLAGAVGLAATGVAVGRRRTWRSYDADELRERLHERLAEAERTAEGTAAQPS